MDFDLSPEHALLRSTIRDFMVKESSLSSTSTRRPAASGRHRRRLGDMGWLGIPYPEEEGGAGSTRWRTRSRSRRSAGCGARSG